MFYLAERRIGFSRNLAISITLVGVQDSFFANEKSLQVTHRPAIL